MRGLVSAIVVGSAFLFGGASRAPEPAVACTPAYFELDEPVAVSVGVSEISFRLLAIGCREDLQSVWPPSMDALERALLPDLREPHPVQTLMLIRDRSPELREKIVKRLNAVFEQRVVHDVFLFDAKVAEY